MVGADTPDRRDSSDILTSGGLVSDGFIMGWLGINDVLSITIVRFFEKVQMKKNECGSMQHMLGSALEC